MKLQRLILTVCLSVAATLVTVYATGGMHKNENAASAHKETAFERITRTNTLRCGYAMATPWFYVDPKTNQKTGYDYDVTNRIAEKIGLKVDWAEETGWGVVEQGLIAGRYDMMCGAVCIDPRRSRAALFSTPFKHDPLHTIVRADDTRFNSNLEKINDPSVRLGVKSGHVFEFIAREQFPQAQLVYGNDFSDDTDFFLMLTSNKIDVAFGGQRVVDMFNQANNNAIRSVNQPVRYCDGAYMMNLGEHDLKQMMDNALLELTTAGELEKIAARYMPVNDKYIRLPAQPFR